MNRIVFKPIGIIHSPFKEPKGIPIQPGAARGVQGTVEVFDKYAEGLSDLEGFSHIALLFHFHLSKNPSLMVKPFLDDKIRGVFATRAPNRPNQIGLSVVRLIGVSGNILQVQDIDIVDGTPLLDIKPYIKEFDARDDFKRGWLEQKVHNLPEAKDDGRFVK